ncbi:MAG: hypothetical protein ABII13_04015 [Patescibacteria group bacterium]
MKIFDKHCSDKIPLCLTAFLQALGLIIYCSLIGLVLWRGETLFGQVPNFMGPVLLLVLFATSALICALITLGHPIILFYKKKEPVKALKLIALTAGWLVLFIVLLLGVMSYK